MKTNCLRKYFGQNLEVNEDVADRNQGGLTGWRKTQGNWVVETGWRLPRKEVTDDICLRRPRPKQGCRIDDDNDDDDGDDDVCLSKSREVFAHRRSVECCTVLQPDVSGYVL